MFITFRTFVEKKEKEEPENYLDGMWRELGVDPNTLPDFIESGPIEIPDENIIYNQAVWQILKPIELSDKFIRMKFCKCTGPNINQHAYRRKEDGKLEVYPGSASGRVHLVPIDKFAELLGRGWQSAVIGGGMGAGGLPGGGILK